MNELIQIATDAQGESTVSARELHAKLEVKAKFADWFKRRAIKCQLQEGEDYIEVEATSKQIENESGEVILKIEKNPSTGGRPIIDYTLTLDTAKELTMVEGNDAGKLLRRYLIRAEKVLRQLATQPLPAPALPTPTQQILLQLMTQSQQLMVGQQAQLDRLRADVDSIMDGQHLPRPQTRQPRQRSVLQLPFVAPVVTHPASLRTLINRKVNEYCGRHGADQRETYIYLYKRLYQAYAVDVHRLPRIGSETLLDVLEHHGHLDRLYALITSELNVPDEQ